MNGPESVALITIVGFTGTTVLVLVRAIARRIDGTAVNKTAEITPETSQRMERMERAVESIAIEVERISESQRFLTKLLAERERAALPAGSAGDQQ